MDTTYLVTSNNSNHRSSNGFENYYDFLPVEDSHIPLYGTLASCVVMRDGFYLVLAEEIIFSEVVFVIYDVVSFSVSSIEKEETDDL